MSRDHTERMMRRARVPLERDGLTATVSQVDELELEEIVVPGDPSSAAFMAVAACLVPESRILIEGMGLNWTRTGFFRIAQRMGAVMVGDLEPEGTVSDEEPVGRPGRGPRAAGGHGGGRRGGAAGHRRADPGGADGGLRRGRHRGARAPQELRHKESDRIEGVVQGLRGLGADIEGLPDGFVVHGTGEPLRGGTIDALGDHRLAMLGAVAGLASREGWRWWAWTWPPCPTPASSRTWPRWRPDRTHPALALLSASVRRLLALLAVPVALCALAPAAGATFKGGNGRVAYALQSNGIDDSGAKTDYRAVATVQPDGRADRFLGECQQTAGQTVDGNCLIQYRSPAWRRDGKELAFDAGTGLGFVSATGTALRTLPRLHRRRLPARLRALGPPAGVRRAHRGPHRPLRAGHRLAKGPPDRRRPAPIRTGRRATGSCSSAAATCGRSPPRASA